MSVQVNALVYLRDLNSFKELSHIIAVHISMIHIQYIIITVTWSEVSDQVVDKHGSPDQMRLGALLENNEISFWDFLLKKFFFEWTAGNWFLCQLQINFEQVLKLKILLKPYGQRDAFIFWRICRFRFEAQNTVPYGWHHRISSCHVLCIGEKNIVYYVNTFTEGWHGFRKLDVVIRNNGSHSVKSKVSTLLTLMGI